MTAMSNRIMMPLLKEMVEGLCFPVARYRASLIDAGKKATVIAVKNKQNSQWYRLVEPMYTYASQPLNIMLIKKAKVPPMPIMAGQPPSLSCFKACSNRFVSSFSLVLFGCCSGLSTITNVHMFSIHKVYDNVTCKESLKTAIYHGNKYPGKCARGYPYKIASFDFWRFGSRKHIFTRLIYSIFQSDTILENGKGSIDGEAERRRHHFITSCNKEKSQNETRNTHIFCCCHINHYFAA